MATVFWTPYHLHRLMPAEGHNTIFVYLEDSGQPVLGVSEEDLASLKALVFAEGSALTEIDVLAGDPVFAGSWGPLGDAFPGVYRFRVSSGPYSGGADQALFSLRLAGHDRTYLTSVDLENVVSGGGGDGGGGEGDDPLALLAALLGYNGVYRYTRFEPSGRPTEGTMTVYRTAADAAAEANPVFSVNLSYSYENGRLTKVKKLFDFDFGGA